MTADSFDGKRFFVPASRRLSWDLLYFHRAVPLTAHDRRFEIHQIAVTRSASSARISWPAIFLKAFALVSQRIPEFRRVWYRWPWAHLYQSPISIGVMTMERIVGADRWLFWARIQQPDQLPLTEIQRQIDMFRDEPAEKVFSRQWKLAHLPTVFRRVIWWCNLNLATSSRVRRLGSFFLSTLSSRGTEIQLPPSVHTCCLTYGPVTTDGSCRVTLAYDHRVMDGALVADGLRLLEETLKTTILAELMQLTGRSTRESETKESDDE